MAVQHLSLNDYDAAVDAAPLAMVDFWADWCGPCQMLGPVIESLAEKYEGRVLVAKVNLDKDPALAIRNGIELIPTVVFLKNGREFHRITGVTSAETLAEILDRNGG